jgi:hypothetical protein
MDLPPHAADHYGGAGGETVSPGATFEGLDRRGLGQGRIAARPREIL